VAGAAAWPLVAHARDAFGLLRTADPGSIVAAGVLHVAMLVASALCWRRGFGACGGSVGCIDASLRYGVGTFLNAVTPARAGCAVRIGLFARSLDGERAMQRTTVALIAIGSMRGAVLAVLVAVAAIGGILPVWLGAAPFALAGVAALARRRLKDLRTHLGACDAAAVFGWAALAAACRWASVAAALLAVGVRSPVIAGLIGLVGLELSAFIPLAPGLAGVGGAAVAVAIAGHGVPSATAIAGGVAFYVAEAGAGVAFGLFTTTAFLLHSGTPWRSGSADGDVPVPIW
jgi:uncharacterized membrane protein YbhN (UPF0104 family)